MSGKLKIIEGEEWFEALVNDIKAILTEGIFNYRWTLIKTYHLVGHRILEEKRLNPSRRDVLARSLGQSERTIQRAVQFVQKYPDLDSLPGGKNISWRKIVNEYLPEEKEECRHEWEEVIVKSRCCRLCGKKECEK